MKKQVLTFLLVAIAGISSYAQCGKKNVLTSSVTEYLNTSGEIQRSQEELTTIEFDSKNIIITPGNNTMEGSIDSIYCDWKTPYKEGKTVIKTVLSGSNGRTMNGTITIEGKDGKLFADG
ncbi:MAG: hypothetical protein IPL50_10385 [Chitinophagaceae bacterium]|nr:hypothetical protein [Chitinophagaceae bacterium]